MAVQNTPTPWTLQAPYLGSYRITAMQGPIKVSPCVASSLDDADLIVRAVNAHADLVAALKLANAAMNHMGDALNDIDAVTDEDVERHGPAFSAVRAALAKAEAL